MKNYSYQSDLAPASGDSSGEGATTAFLTLATLRGDMAQSSLSSAYQSQMRSNLGLGSIATQAASSVAITGGSIAGATITSGTLDGTSIGSTTPSSIISNSLAVSVAGSADATVYLNRPAGRTAQIIGETAGSARWAMSFGTYTAESGSNVGSDFNLTRYNDSGSGVDTPLTVSRATGVFNFLYSPIAPTPSPGDNSTKLATTAFVGFDPPDGRLTLASATPVMAAAVSAAGTIYYTPYLGNMVPVWNGASFGQATFAEVSQALSDTTKSPAAAAASQVYDVFGWMDGTTFRATRGPTWAAGATAGSNTARGTGAGSSALSRVQGVLVNAYAITNGPAAGYGVYLGTFATDSSGVTVTWSAGTSAAGGGKATLNVWNYYNRVKFCACVRDSTASHTYKTASYQAFDTSTANSVSFVRGVSEDQVLAQFGTRVTPAAAGAFVLAGIGLDSSTALAASAMAGYSLFSATGNSANIESNFAGDPGIGAHTLYAIEQSDGTNANTFYGYPYAALTAEFIQ